MSVIANRPKSSQRFETYAWFYLRVSGLLLVLLVLAHFAIMHLYYGVEHIDFDVIAARYRTPFWPLYDLLLLALALSHGLLGCKLIIDDYIHRKGWRIAAVSFAAIVAAVLLAMGAYTIVTFAAIQWASAT